VLSLALTLVCPIVLPIAFAIVGLVRIRRSGDRGRLLAVIAIVLNILLLAGVIAVPVLIQATRADRDESGRVTEAGTVSMTQLRTGDCMPDKPDAINTSVEVVPCSSPHWGQVISSFDLPSGSYPGDFEVQQLSEDGCVDRLNDEVRERIADEELGLFYFHPQRASWSADRTVNCVVFAEQGLLTEVLPSS
jgi:hypothetical protein